MPDQLRKNVFSAVVIVGILSLAGCSIIGGIIGIAASKSESYSIPGWEITEVKPGSDVKIQTNDGVVYEGEFVGLYDNLDPDYSADYEKARAADEGLNLLPRLNSEIVVARNGSAPVSARLMGFNLNSLAVRTREDAPIQSIAYDTIRQVRLDDESVLPIGQITDLIDQRRIPVLSRIVVSYGTESDMIQVRDVALVEYETKTNYGGTGFLIGAVIDVAIIVAVSAAEARDKKKRARTSTGEFSCPFIYSFDGDNFVLDGETFGGAIFQAAQRTDVDNLDYLRPTGGEYRIKVTNELPETQYIDELNLLVVDHPAGSEIIPSFDESLHTITSPQSPIRVIDAASFDVSAALKNKDGNYWTSNPFGRSAALGSDVRDFVDIEFPRDLSDEHAKLVLTVRNTSWGSYLQGQMLSLMGDGIDAWYELMNSSEEARNELTATMIREGMLLVKMWDGRAWQQVGFVWEVGPSIAKEQAVLFDIPRTAASSLKIRLESTAGLWMIDQARIDYSSAKPISVTEIAPKYAVGHTGEDLLSELAAIDQTYYEMPSIDYWAELRYDIPPAHSDLARTVLAKSTGYYTIHPPASVEERPELLSQFINEPQAYGRFTVSMLNNLLKQARYDRQIQE